MLIQINKFSGEVPRVPPHSLQDGYAQYAKNCVFSHGELRPMNKDFLLNSHASLPIYDLYTRDGLTFFAWSQSAYPQRSPIPEDQYNRVYYVESNKLRVTVQSPCINPCRPTGYYTTGVPTPSGFHLSKETNGNGYPDDVAKLVHTFFWEAGFNRYQETEITPSQTLNGGKKYTYSSNIIPNKEYNIVTEEDADGNTVSSVEWVTPPNAVPVIQIEGYDDDNNVVFVLYAGDSSKSNSTEKLKAGVTVKLEVNDPVYGVTLPGESDKTETNVLTDANLTAEISWAEDDTRAYVVTAVNLWGEEGAPSDPIIERFSAIDTPKVSNITLEGGYSQYREIASYRIYRTATGSSGTQFFFVDEIPAGQVLVDERKDEELGEELPSENWYPSPSSVQILELMPNGIFAAASGNTLYFSQPYLPHAWNPLDAIAFEQDIVAMKAHESGLVVVTKSGPYLISGVSPDAMTMTKMSVPHSALNSRAITRAGNGVIYASHDGLVVISGASGSVQASMKLWTRSDWHDLTWDSRLVLKLAAHDGKIIIHDLHAGGFAAETESYVIDLDEASGQLTQTEPLGAASFVLPSTDGLYFARNKSIYQFQDEESGSRNFVWKSKRYILNKPVNFSVIEVDCSNDATLRVYTQRGASDLMTSQTINLSAGNNRYRLVSGFRSRIWEIEIESTSQPIVIRSITLANSRMELGRA